MLKICLYGAGGLGSVVVDAIRKIEQLEMVGFIDDTMSEGTLVKGFPVIANEQTLSSFKDRYKDVSVIVTIGNLQQRSRLISQLKNFDIELCTVIHPFTSVASEVEIEQGCYIGHGVLVGTDVVIKEGTFVTDGASIGHHSIIGRCSHVTGGVNIGARVTVGEECMIGMSSTLVSDVTVGNGVFVATGSLVTKNVAKNMMVVGSPARPIRKYNT